jgi:hypothetical protein
VRLLRAIIEGWAKERGGADCGVRRELAAKLGAGRAGAFVRVRASMGSRNSLAKFSKASRACHDRRGDDCHLLVTPAMALGRRQLNSFLTGSARLPRARF